MVAASSLLLLAAALVGGAAKPRKKGGAGPPPGGLPNIPGLGGLGGKPPWRLALDQVFDSACDSKARVRSVFCFPDKEALLEALKVEQYGVDESGEMFLSDFKVVIDQLLEWPPAWDLLPAVLDPKLPRTKAFCSKVVGFWFPLIPLVRRGFISPRQTLTQTLRTQPRQAEGMKRWLDGVRKKADAQTRRILTDFEMQDAEDAKNKTCRARPLINLMQHLHAKVLYHIMGKACKGSPEARKRFEEPDAKGLTMLHHAVSVGDTAAVRAILKATAKGHRKSLASARDNLGYTPADWAALGDFADISAALRNVGSAAVEGGDAARSAERIFPAAAAKSDACAADGAAAASCELPPTSAGGWRLRDADAVPAEWLPADAEGCAADVIDASQFDFDVFMQHYVLHPRPLLIRRGASFNASGAAEAFSRTALLAAAGDRTISAERFPGAKEYDGSAPRKETLRKYLERLGNRTAKKSAEKLHYAYLRLEKDEAYLKFANDLPKLLAGRVEHIGTSFHVGGARMGVPPLHRPPLASSLQHGEQLWFLDPPGRELIAHQAIFDFLQRTDGMPGAQRCLQKAGDLLVVPRGWTHGVICLGDCVGVDHEFTHAEWDLKDN